MDLGYVITQRSRSVGVASLYTLSHPSGLSGKRDQREFVLTLKYVAPDVIHISLTHCPLIRGSHKALTARGLGSTALQESQERGDPHRTKSRCFSHIQSLTLHRDFNLL